MKRPLLLLIAALSAAAVAPARAQTDGSASFQVTTVTAGGAYAPRNVMAIWVTDANTNFVKTLKRQAQSQIRWLSRWGTISQSNVVDGITGATLSSHQAHTVTWNGRNTAGAIVPDGVYRIFIEFTEFNGAGPFLQAVSFTKGATGVTSTPANVANFTGMRLAYAPIAGPPILNPIGDKFATESNTVQFSVTATPTGGDPVTLSVSNKPPLATFIAANTSGTFTWAAAAPVGVYTMSFHAVDKDGVASETIRLHVTPTGTASFGFARGSPVISGDPADPDENFPGDDMDLDRSGGFVTGSSQGGFGDFGRLYFNHDASNLYIGATGCNVAGPSNAIVILLGVSTLTNDAVQLWAKSGKPTGLDALHNIAVTTPMDIAILVGDEFGDATFPDFSLANGYNFGQGVFLLGATSFPAVAGARLSQFDGTEGPTAGPNDDGNRLTERWECSIPWSSLNATGLGSIASVHIAGVIASSATNSVDRFLSGNYIGASVDPPTNGNYGFGFVAIAGRPIALAAGHDIALTSVAPGIANPNTTAWVRVGISNRQDNAETFAVAVSNVTAGVSVGTVIVSNLPPRGATNVAVAWNTAGIPLGTQVLRVGAGPLAAEVNVADNALDAPFVVRAPFHDVALTAFVTPPWVRAGTASNLLLSVSNLGDYAESVTVAVTDSTDRVSVGLAGPVALSAYGATNLVITWNTTGRSTNLHALSAYAAAVPGETQFANNARSALVPVAPGLVTNVLVARGATWRYRQDGVDQSRTPWRQTNYFDTFWPQGAAPLGFGNGGEATVLSSTQHVTYYFRGAFASDGKPVSLTVRTRHDDGIVASLNGAEIARANMPAGDPVFTGRASSAVSQAAETNWVPLSVAASNIVVGWNTVAAEVHQASGAAASVEPWFNEIHYDNTDTDVDEGVEIAGPAGLSLTNYRVICYNGADGLLYSNVVLTGVLPDQSNGIGTVWLPLRSLQNGPDAVALVKASTGVVQFLSYEGSFTAQNGPASGTRPVNLPVTEPGSVGQALQLRGTGVAYAAFTWTGPATHSRGHLNSGQAIPPADPADLAFDMEWIAVMPAIPVRRDVRVGEIAVSSDATAGDTIVLTLVVTNAGNATTPFQVVVINTNNGQRVGAAVSDPLLPGEVRALSIPWPTTGLAPGGYGLAAYVVIDGVTNVAGGRVAQGTVSGTGLVIPSSPAPGSLGGFCGAIATAPGRGYLGEGATLAVLDLSAPGSIVRRGSIRLPGVIRGLAVAGTHVYAACGEFGMHIVDAGNADAPVLVRSFNSSGFASGVDVEGTRLALADGIQGVRLFDVAAPSAPVLVGSFATTGPAVAVDLAGTIACVLDGFEGLVTLDIATPTSPAVLGRASIPYARAIAVSGATALVSDDSAGLTTVDIGDPAAPVIAGRISLPAPARSVVRSGSVVYAAAGDAGVLVLDLAMPGAPVLAATVDTPGEASAVSLLGASLCVADGFAGLQAFSVSSPLAPAAQASMQTGLRGRDTAVHGNTAFVAAGEEGVLLFDITDAAQPTPAGSLAIANARRIVLDGDRAYVAAGFGGLTIAGLSTTASPSVIGAYSNPALVSVHAIAADGPRVAMTDGRRIVVIDAANPASPVPVAQAMAAGYAHDLAWCGGALAVADGPAGVTILDRTSLARIGGYDTPGRALAIRCAGNVAVVADGDAGWLTLDLANPASPVLLSAGAGAAVDVALDGSRMFTVGGHDAMRSMDISAPLAPVPAENVSSLTRALRLRAGNQRVFVSEDDAGVAIVQPPTTDADGDGLPDWWEQALVDANPNDAVSSIADVLPGGDFDGDGASNREEQQAGSSAIDASSTFLVQSTSPQGAQFVVRWNSAAGRAYTLHASTDLTAGFTPVARGIVATYPVNAFTTTVNAAGSFFMVTVDP